MKRLASMVVATTVVATPIVVASTATPASAYCRAGFGHWTSSTQKLWGARSIPRAWRTSIKNANVRWNGISGSRLRYTGPGWTGLPRVPRYVIGRQNFATAGWPDVPGITFGAQNTQARYVTIALNSRFHWNTTGGMNQRRRQVDVWTVAVHEMGHASGLAHPWACDGGRMTRAERASVMNVTWTRKRYPNSDDKAGIRRIY